MSHNNRSCRNFVIGQTVGSNPMSGRESQSARSARITGMRQTGPAWVRTRFRFRVAAISGRQNPMALQHRRDMQESSVVVSRGILSYRSLVVTYYTAEPSPGQWVAVGTVMFWPTLQDSGFPRWMLVGVGRSERSAVSNLRARIKESVPPRWKIKLDPPAPVTSEPRSTTAASAAREYVVPWEIEQGAVEARERGPLASVPC